MAFICLCGQRYESQRQSVGCVRCAERAAARRTKAATPRQRPPAASSAGAGRAKKTGRQLRLDGLPLDQALKQAVGRHINRVGVPARDVLAAGSPVAAVSEAITQSCSSADLRRFWSEAADMARAAGKRGGDSLAWAIEEEFHRQIANRSRTRKRTQVRSVVSGGLPGMGRRA